MSKIQHYCNVCNYVARDSFNMNKHVNTQKHKQMCIVAGMTNENAIENINVNENNPKDHSPRQTYACNLCGNKYAYRQSLWKHRITNHKKDPQMEEV